MAKMMTRAVAIGAPTGVEADEVAALVATSPVEVADEARPGADAVRPEVGHLSVPIRTIVKRTTASAVTGAGAEAVAGAAEDAGVAADEAASAIGVVDEVGVAVDRQAGSPEIELRMIYSDSHECYLSARRRLFVQKIKFTLFLFNG